MSEKRETRQKKAIEETIGRTNSFFTAEDLHEKLKKESPNIGIATVYRFLNELKKERKVHSYLCNRKSLYSKKEMNHSHFICEICGETKHMTIDKVDFLKKFPDEDICHVQIELSGICKTCKSRR